MRKNKIIRVLSKVFIIFILIFITIFSIISLSSCTEADKVNRQLSNQADYFDIERRITVYNARTDTIILTVEGYMSISNNLTDELVVTCKVGSNEYKKNYVYLNAYTLYVVEDISGSNADPYHYKMYFHTEILPDIEVLP